MAGPADLVPLRGSDASSGLSNGPPDVTQGYGAERVDKNYPIDSAMNRMLDAIKMEDIQPQTPVDDIRPDIGPKKRNLVPPETVSKLADVNCLERLIANPDAPCQGPWPGPAPAPGPADMVAPPPAAEAEFSLNGAQAIAEHVHGGGNSWR